MPKAYAPSGNTAPWREYRDVDPLPDYEIQPFLLELITGREGLCRDATIEAREGAIFGRKGRES